uniref:Putative secreted protein n=1 Tax=Amblyomma triste TaxID=251400 RepID=A0A023G3P4_AMBTT
MGPLFVVLLCVVCRNIVSYCYLSYIEYCVAALFFHRASSIFRGSVRPKSVASLQLKKIEILLLFTYDARAVHTCLYKASCLIVK